MTVSEIKIERLQPEKSRNMFEQIQKMKKSRECTVQYVHSNPNTLLLTSRGRAPKGQQWVLILKLSQEPKIAMKPREVRLQKGPRGLGLNTDALSKKKLK